MTLAPPPPPSPAPSPGARANRGEVQVGRAVGTVTDWALSPLPGPQPHALGRQQDAPHRGAGVQPCDPLRADARRRPESTGRSLRSLPARAVRRADASGERGGPASAPPAAGPLASRLPHPRPVSARDCVAKPRVGPARPGPRADAPSCRCRRRRLGRWRCGRRAPGPGPPSVTDAAGAAGGAVGAARGPCIS